MTQCSNPWSHQQTAVQKALDAHKAGQRRALWVMPTGSGKTRAFSDLSARLACTTLVVVHREELARQALDALRQARPGVTACDLRDKKGWLTATVLVATVQLLVRRLPLIPPDQFDLVVIDEAHHAAAKTW